MKHHFKRALFFGLLLVPAVGIISAREKRPESPRRSYVHCVKKHCPEARCQFIEEDDLSGTTVTYASCELPFAEESLCKNACLSTYKAKLEKLLESIELELNYTDSYGERYASDHSQECVFDDFQEDEESKPSEIELADSGESEDTQHQFNHGIELSDSGESEDTQQQFNDSIELSGSEESEHIHYQFGNVTE